MVVAVYRVGLWCVGCRLVDCMKSLGSDQEPSDILWLIRVLRYQYRYLDPIPSRIVSFLLNASM